MNTRDESRALIAGVHRSVRWLDEHESAFAGELVADGERLRLRVDAPAAADVLWSFAAAEHVAGVRDVVRRRDGQDALLPWCAEPVDVFLGRREAAAQPLTVGEIVTLVGSVLRGIVESAQVEGRGNPAVREVHGRWWLQDDARPIFAPGVGIGCAAAGAEIIMRLREGCADRAVERVLAEILAGVHDPRAVVRGIERWETELTELAAPRPLNRDVHAPERVSSIPLHQALVPQAVQRVAAQRSMRDQVVSVQERLVEWTARHRPRRRPRVAKPSAAAAEGRGDRADRGDRGRMLLIGAAAAAAVLLGGLLWPTGGADSTGTAARAGVDDQPLSSAGESSSSASSASDSAARRPADSKPSDPESSPAASAGPPAGAEVAPDTVALAVQALLERVAGCAAEADARCADAVVDGAGDTVLQRLGSADAARKVTPIEDYGDIAVVRLGAVGDHGEQMLVIVREKDGWLVRDVYDVADQPSDGG